MPKKKVQKRRALKDGICRHLPSDVLSFIFTSLPARSLLRFKCVCKPWNAIFSETEFIKTHHNQSKLLCRKKLLLRLTTGNFEFRDLKSRQLIIMEKQQFRLIKRFRDAQVLCSCDGLVLLKNQYAYKNFVLWNPSTREYRTLVCPYLNHYDKCPNACGLCYDSSFNDYKVILIYNLFYAVYSLSNDSWTKKTSFPCPIQYSYRRCYQGINTEGGVFWSLSHRNITYYVHSYFVNTVIIYFDVKSDEVKSLPMPDFVGEKCLFHMTSLKGCLSLYGGTMGSEQLDIWIMERDGWKLLMNICDLPTICREFIEDRKVLYCTEDGEILFQDVSRRNLVIYNSKRQQFVTVDDIPNGYRSMTSICLDSLYFPDSVTTRNHNLVFPPES